MRLRQSLTTKLMLTISVIMITVAGIMLAVDYHMAKKDQQKTFDNNVQLQLQLVRSALTEAVFAYDYSQLETISKSLVDTEIIASLNIYDHRKKTLGKAQEQVDPEHAVPFNEQEIKRGDKVIGKFDIVFSSHRVSELLFEQMRQAAVLVLLLLGAALITTYIVSKRLIAKPINDVAAALRDIADGEGDLTRRLSTYSGDEVALLSHHFNRVIEQIAGIITNVKDVTGQVEDNVTAMSGATDRTVHSTDEQLHEIEQATAALTQLAQSAQEVAGYANTAADQTNSTAQLADDSARIVETSRTTTAQLSDQIEATTQKVSVLRDKSGNIGSVMEVIRSIAEQTNLLALNAAIEAARAGEQGRGFAVVADEVRSLAQKTQNSTEEIESIIAELQRASDEAHASMHTSKDSVTATVSSATQISDSLEKIRANISGIDTMNQQMANAAKEQSITSNEVSKNVTNIYNLSHQVADDAKIVNHNSQELKSESAELHEQLSRFKL